MSGWLDVVVLIDTADMAEFEAIVERSISGLDVTYHTLDDLPVGFPSSLDIATRCKDWAVEEPRPNPPDLTAIWLELRNSAVLHRLRVALADMPTAVLREASIYLQSGKIIAAPLCS